VSRCEQDIEGHRANGDRVTFGHESVRLRGGRHVDPGPQPDAFGHGTQQRQIALVEPERRAGKFFEPGARHDVIEMRVRGQDLADGPARSLGRPENQVGAVDRVDHHGLAAGAIANQVTICLDRTQDKLPDLNCHAA